MSTRITTLVRRLKKAGLLSLIIRKYRLQKGFIFLLTFVLSCWQAWHAWAVMNFEAVLHYKHQNQARDEKKKLRHASGASITSANTEGSNSESDAESTENSPIPSPVQKKVTEVPFFSVYVERLVLTA